LLGGLLVLLFAGALLLFWNASYKAVPIAALGLAGTALATAKLPDGTRVDPSKRRFSPQAANIAVLVIMGIALVIWLWVTRHS